MMYNSNRHVHMWGESVTGKGCFCLICGFYLLNTDKEGYITPQIDVMWPDCDVEEDIKEAGGY